MKKTKLYKLMGVALIVVLLASLTVGLAAVPASGAESSKLKWTKLDMPKVEDINDNAGDFSDTEGDYWCAPATDVGPIAMSPDGSVLFAVVGGEGYFAWTNYWYQVVKSTDDGFSWIATGFWDAWASARADTKLDGDINDTGTTITVDSTADFPAAGVIVIEYEIISYTAKTATTFTGCTRGIYNSNADDHDSGATVGLPDGTSVMDIVVSPDYDEDTTVMVASKFTVYQSIDGGKSFVCMDNDPDWAADGERIRDMDIALDDRGRTAIMVGTYDWNGGGDAYVFSTETGQQWQEQGVGQDVMACAFIPPFEDTEGLCVVATSYGPEVTNVMFSFGNTADGGGWGTDIMNAPVKDSEGYDISTWWADIGFPDDFDAFGTGSNVLFVGIYVEDWENIDPPFPADGVRGDVYKIICKEAGTSSAVDMDVRGVVTTLLPTETDIVSIDVCGNADEATILAGTGLVDMTATPERFLAYVSEDSGETWTPAFNGPTGGDVNLTAPDGAGLSFDDPWPHVLMGPDFCSDGVAYCSSIGDMTSAFQRTADGGTSFFQISLIDYGDEDAGYWPTPLGFNAAGYNAEGMLRMITMVGGDYGALWQRVSEKNWVRMLSYANPGVTRFLFQLQMPADGSAIFAVDLGNGEMWRSTDFSTDSATFPKKITTKDDLTWVAAVSATSLYTGHANGGLWWSTKSGVGWTKPDDSEIPTGEDVFNVTVMGEGEDAIVIVTTDGGTVCISSDGGETVEKVGKSNPGNATSSVLAGADLGFANNGLLYATIIGDEGVYRNEVDLDSPGANSWERIDDNQDSTGLPVEYDEGNLLSSSPPICLPPSNILYVTDTNDVNGDTGGLWRSTNPADDTDSVEPPYFMRANKGLDDSAEVGLLGLDLDTNLAPTFFCANADPDDYWEQIVLFTDTLHVGVPQADPVNNATGVGLLPEGYVYPEVTFVWEEMAGATSYQYQVAIDADFKTRVADDFTSSLATDPIELYPNETYYWRIRVADEGTLLGAPLISPWSETWKFKTALGAVEARPKLEAPWPGEPDVSLKPTFEWSGIEWAEKYEFELATDPTTGADGYFTSPLKSLKGADSLVSTAWLCDTTLDYETRYYWHVIAIGVDTETPWSDVGTFTTMGVPPEAPEQVPPVVIPPAEQITPAWIWAIVIIGAILVIAVIVLIVTTRRVP